MTIWILAILVLGAAAGMGIRQGAIRAGFALVGILLAALLAAPLGHFLKPAVALVGIKNPVALWMIPPVLVFLIVSVLFRTGAYFVHHKVEMFYKYKAGDLRYALWERLNHRLGLCLGIVNGLVYLVLISFVIYILSYWTVQLAAAEPASDPRGIRFLNRLGWDLQSTGMSGVARSIDRMPAAYYETADLVGMLYATPLLEARLNLYPAFLSLAQQPEFQAILNDTQLTELWKKQPPVRELMSYPAIHSILKNPDLLRQVWSIVEPDLADLRTFLTTGKSPKYDSEPILGRWDFDVNGALSLVRRSKPNITPKEMLAVKNWLVSSYTKTTLIAMLDQQILFKDFPHIKVTPGAAPTTESLDIPGQWRSSQGKYSLTYTVDGRSEDATAEINGDQLTVAGQGLGMVFDREQ